MRIGVGCGSAHHANSMKPQKPDGARVTERPKEFWIPLSSSIVVLVTRLQNLTDMEKHILFNLWSVKF